MSVIEIINSSFAYKDTGSNNERKVLAIDNLNIRPGEITFIVGVSGAGKSTMLETIGLMNDTFPSDMNKEAMRIYFNLYNSKTGEIERISITNPNIWDDTDENMALRETIRKDNYSFIFQNTNLMPNFSALENVCITDMLNGHCFEEAYMKALLIFKTLGLGDLDITISPQNVSGGQRQRIAFARALIPEYRVLFGDEPTGNLDRKTSYEVMGILHDYIKSTQSGNDSTSTVIVSHDLELAVRYADRIIVITKLDGKGTIHPEHIFVNTEEEVQQTPAYDFKSAIRGLFIQNSDAEEQMIALRKKIMKALYFQRQNSEGSFRYRKYITVNDYLSALLEELKRTPDNPLLFDADFIVYLTDLLLHKITESGEKEEISADSAKIKSNCHNWNTPFGKKSKDTYTDRQVMKYIEKLLAVDKNHAVDDKDAAFRSKIADNEYVESGKGLKDYLYFFFLWLTRRLPDRTGLNPQFTKLFYEKESIELLGYHSRLRNFWTVFVIMLVTFMAIGFANGSLIYLGRKMQDPFVNFINVAVPADYQADVDVLIDALNDDRETLDKYGVNKATGFTIFPLEFVQQDKYDLPLITGRTISLEDPLLSVLLKPSNVIKGEIGGFRSSQDYGLIVSQKMLTDLGYPLDTKFVEVHIVDGDNTSADIPVPVRTVLKRLPGDLDDEISFLITDFLHANLVKPISETNRPFSPQKTNSLTLFLDSRDTAEAKEMVRIVQDFINERNRKIKLDGSIYHFREPRLLKYSVDSTYYECGFSLNIPFMGRKPEFQAIEVLYDSMTSLTAMQKKNMSMLYTHDFYSMEQISDVNRRLDRLTIHFLKLDRIDSFENEYIKPNYPYIRLDMAKIESLKNYNYISRLTIGLSIILVILSVYSIASFLSNVFENHL
ncbi:MAG: ABC transporter ATP-binding protein, partial [Bacteroidales bacterium]|nr:ABC transporter ATP-binding protein [Bacteroidales bacterium]MDD3962550.1 ABC transporter ATP-binding protein [Bacteroidales bacterium]MDY0286037.1 ABC transporter ATP-binding protein [Bacteroidales bacterium]